MTTTRLVGCCGSLVLLSALGFGCGSSGSTATVTSFCEELAAKECGTKAATNCNVTQAACKTARIAACTTWATGIQVAFPTTRPFTPGGIGACVSKAGELYDKSPITPADRADAQAVCERVFAGSIKKNLTCASDYECATGLICDPVFRVCATTTTLQASDPCGVAGAFCAPGLYCSLPPGLTLKVCVAKKAMGDACDVANPCAETLRCDAVTATCQKRSASAEPCATDADCLPTAPYCDPFSPPPLTCYAGFIPGRREPECAIFGATLGAGGASGAVGGAAGGTSGAVGGAAGGSSGGLRRAGGV